MLLWQFKHDYEFRYMEASHFRFVLFEAVDHIDSLRMEPALNLIELFNDYLVKEAELFGRPATIPKRLIEMPDRIGLDLLFFTDGRYKGTIYKKDLEYIKRHINKAFEKIIETKCKSTS